MSEPKHINECILDIVEDLMIARIHIGDEHLDEALENIKTADTQTHKLFCDVLEQQMEKESAL